MTGGQLNPLLYCYSRLAFMYKPIKRYGYGHGSKGSYSRLMEERAPSVAQEFERVAAEKVRESEQLGESSQSGGDQATLANSKVDESAKESCKQHEPAADYQREGVNN